jgi:hypothetical protein
MILVWYDDKRERIAPFLSWGCGAIPGKAKLKNQNAK